MRASRALVLVVLFVAAVAAAWWFTHRQTTGVGEAIDVYYAKADGTTLVPWRVSLGPARDRASVAFYAATQAVAGPPAGTDAVRFPAGTHVQAVDVQRSEEHTSELQSRQYLVCRLLLEKKKKKPQNK